MNRTRPFRPARRLAGTLATLATALLAAATAAPAAFAIPVPPMGGSGGPTTIPEPPGWYKHPPLPLGHVTGPTSPVHTVVVGGMPGWQIALIAIAAAVVAAAVAVFLDRARATRRHQVAPSA